MPYVHLASPGRRHASASRAACWSTIRPASGTSAPNADVVPTTSSQAAMRGQPLVGEPEDVEQPRVVLDVVEGR